MVERHAPTNREWTRREVLAAGGIGAAVMALAACGGSATRTLRPNGGAPFAQPQELASKDGRLEITLRAEAGTVPFGDARRFAYTYNGASPGPTLRVRPGDRLVITLENRLDEPTNLHTHGLHVSPSGDSDNIFVQVDPGKTHVYTYDIPTDHRSSLCWYHPHHHGMVAPQLGGGLFGGIIIEDDLDQVSEIASSTERLLILNDPRIGDTSDVIGASGMQVMQGREGDAASSTVRQRRPSRPPLAPSSCGAFSTPAHLATTDSPSTAIPSTSSPPMAGASPDRPPWTRCCSRPVSAPRYSSPPRPPAPTSSGPRAMTGAPQGWAAA